MSHVVHVAMEITDLKLFAATCDELGLTFAKGQTTFQWYGRWVNDYNAQEAAVSQGIDPTTFGQCVHAVRIKGTQPGEQYEIGLIKSKDGPGYNLIYDSWSSGGRALEKCVGGKKMSTLKRAYSTNVTKQQMKRKGFRFMGMKKAKNGRMVASFVK